MTQHAHLLPLSDTVSRKSGQTEEVALSEGQAEAQTLFQMLYGSQGFTMHTNLIYI